jgi:hypothetical protein
MDQGLVWQRWPWHSNEPNMVFRLMPPINRHGSCLIDSLLPHWISRSKRTYIHSTGLIYLLDMRKSSRRIGLRPSERARLILQLLRLSICISVLKVHTQLRLVGNPLFRGDVTASLEVQNRSVASHRKHIENLPMMRYSAPARLYMS